jgi:hypothetical protein
LNPGSHLENERKGHLFQGRFKAILVDGDEYIKELSRYIHLNPVRAGMVEEDVKLKKKVEKMREKILNF